jgi:hypothetical protein
MPVEPQLILDELEPGSGNLLDQADFEIGERRSALLDLVEQALEVDAIPTQDVRKVQLTFGLHLATVEQNDPVLTRVDVSFRSMRRVPKWSRPDCRA